MPLNSPRPNRLLSVLLVAAAAVVLEAGAPAAEPSSVLVRRLDEFSGLDPKELPQTYRKAVDEVRTTGGVIEIPATVWKQILGKQAPLQGLTRTPEPPAETKHWADGQGVTVVAHDGKSVIV